MVTLQTKIKTIQQKRLDEIEKELSALAQQHANYVAMWKLGDEYNAVCDKERELVLEREAIKEALQK